MGAEKLARGLALVVAGALWAGLVGCSPPPPPANATYVSTSGSNGSACKHAGPGTPCRTIEYALGTADAGDTIVVKAGTYGSTGEGAIYDWDAPNASPTKKVTVQAD